MSRCLPFPPPEYVWNGVSGRTLLELIKVQRERVKAEREKKKEEKRRKKEKNKESEQGEIGKKKQGHHKRHKRLRINEGEERSKNQGKGEYEIQELETSSLTEELEQPIPDSLYESSDNSQSIRRKRKNISCNDHGCHVQIDFQLQKHKSPEALSSKAYCSTRLMDSIVQKKLELPVEEQISTSAMLTTDVQEFVPPPLKELCHSSQKARLNMDKKSDMTQTESQFRELVVNWIPPPVQTEHFDVGDQEWLLNIKQPRIDIRDKSAASCDVFLQGNFTRYPHAQYLPQANIVALPYTVLY
ncbi:hypothetical protein DITRI_Ditri08aG0138400 [Diplodiscus trichospermus]